MSKLEFSSSYQEKISDLIILFRDVFGSSEGEDEGKRIENLVSNLLNGENNGELFVYSASTNGIILGAIIFSPIKFDQDERSIYMLSPVAVKTTHHNQGIGQKLISFGLADLKKHGVDIAMTYGSPDYYSKTGFKQITTDQAAAPYKLQFPHGWLAQSLGSNQEILLKGASRCVAAFDDPKYW